MPPCEPVTVQEARDELMVPPLDGGLKSALTAITLIRSRRPGVRLALLKLTRADEGLPVEDDPTSMTLKVTKDGTDTDTVSWASAVPLLIDSSKARSASFVR